MDNREFYKKLEAIRKEIAGLPGGDLKATLMNQVKDVAKHHETGREIAAKMEDTLSLLRVHMQYIMFDLEATRRENRELRKRLGENDG